MTESQRLVSYAQHGEDVVLARALGGAPGYYVDVGAGSPDRASVTRHFFEAGWTGIHIEPRPALAAELKLARPGDVVVAAALADASGSVTLFTVDEDGDLSTIDDGHAQELREQGLTVIASEVPVTTLDCVLADAAPERIDFLKIDVEGAEAAVLRGVDLTRWAPRVLVVESTRPNSSEATYESWEPRVLSQGYAFACTDGLNRFYVRADLQAELGPLLVPANPTDHYVPAGVLLLEQEVDRLRSYVTHLEVELEAKSHRLQDIEVAIAKAAPQPSPTWKGQAATDLPPRRIAILGTPRTGSTWLGEMLAHVSGTSRLALHHPADIEWDALPDRLVLQLPWHPTVHLRRLLRRHHVDVVSIARHPLDVLLSVLQFAQREPNTGEWLHGEGGDERALVGASPNDEAFLEWAVGPRAAALLSVTPQWWREEDVLKVSYEGLVEAPEQVLTALSEGLLGEGLDAPAKLRLARACAAAVEAKQAHHLHAASGGVHVWRARPGAWREYLLSTSVDRLVAAYPTVWSDLGYAQPEGEIFDREQAQLAWDLA